MDRRQLRRTMNLGMHRGQRHRRNRIARDVALRRDPKLFGAPTAAEIKLLAAMLRLRRRSRRINLHSANRIAFHVTPLGNMVANQCLI
jgi:hypothetical protein